MGQENTVTNVGHFAVRRADLIVARACFPCGLRRSVIYACDCVSICIVQELCESRGGRPELSVLTSLLVSVDVKNY